MYGMTDEEMNMFGARIRREREQAEQQRVVNRPVNGQGRRLY